MPENSNNGTGTICFKSETILPGSCWNTEEWCQHVLFHNIQHCKGKHFNPPDCQRCISLSYCSLNFEHGEMIPQIITKFPEDGSQHPSSIENYKCNKSKVTTIHLLESRCTYPFSGCIEVKYYNEDLKGWTHMIIKAALSSISSWDPLGYGSKHSPTLIVYLTKSIHHHEEPGLPFLWLSLFPLYLCHIN